MSEAGKPSDGPPNVFPGTRWTLIGRAAGTDPDARPIALAELIRAYTPALRAHLLRSVNGDVHRGEDLLQGFLTDKVLEQQLIAHADQTRGRFRTFLLAALDRYVIDVHRHDAAQKRSPQGRLVDAVEHRESLRDPGAISPAEAFDRAWADEVVGEVVAAMRRECEKVARPDLWTAFEMRYLGPAMDDADPASHEALARRLNLESPQQASNLLVTVKRMFTRLFRAVVSRYAADENEVKHEVADLWRIFATTRRA